MQIAKASLRGFDDITEAEENLEITGKYEQILTYSQTPKGNQLNKSPNIRLAKNKSSSKASIGLKDIGKQDGSYLTEDKGIYKNKAYRFSQDNESSSLVLPVIKESHGIVIFDKKKFELLKKDINSTKMK